MTMASLLEVLLLTFGIFYKLWEEKTGQEKELKIAESERARTLQMLIGVQEDERRRIAGDLHDSIGPMLAAIKINFMRMAKAEPAAAEELGRKTETIIDDSLAEIRAISHRLVPKNLSSKGLITLLSDYFAGLEAMHAIRIHFTHQISVTFQRMFTGVGMKGPNTPVRCSR
jgi:signal transduction histidine kinase